MKGKKVVVTGGCGFIGGCLSAKLVHLGANVQVVDDLSFGSAERAPMGATLHVLDIRDQPALQRVFQDAYAVFHMAAIASVPLSLDDPIRVHSVNALGTVTVLDAARRAGVRRVVYSASSAAYGDQPVGALHERLPASPASPYGLSKYEGELAATLFYSAFGLQTVSLRYFNVYGPGQNPDGPYAAVVARFQMLKRANKPLLVVGDGKQTRDFIMVEDVVEANLAAGLVEDVGKGEVINIGSGTSTSVIALAKLIGGNIEYAPARQEIRHSQADISLAQKLLKFNPSVSLAEGLAKCENLARSGSEH